MLGNPAIARPRAPTHSLDARGYTRSFAPEIPPPSVEPSPPTSGISPELGKAVGDGIAGIIKGIGDAIGGGKAPPPPPPPPPSIIAGVKDSHLFIGAAVALLGVVVVWRLAA